MSSRIDGNGVIVIGIDFGTTFTGVAYSYFKAGNNGPSDTTPQPITLWPSGANEAESDTPKVPSCISYSRGGTIHWGHQVGDKEAGISWSKLLLLDDADLQLHLKNSDHIKQARMNVEATGKDVVTIISKFLEKVWNHALEAITRARGQQFISTHPFHVVATVPAIWQDYAVQQMELALRKAGILSKRPGCAETTFTFVSEPEAAALAAIDAFNRHDVLEPGQTCVIADLGGGTVDLISFRVKSAEPQLLLEEIVEGNGALCGATFLDQAFLTCLEQKMRQKKQSNKSTKSWQQLHQRERERITSTVWEKGIKRRYYDGQLGHRIDLGAQGTRRLDVWLPGDDLNDVFNSVYHDISRLIKDQVTSIANKTANLPQFIALAGGFGRCEYIYNKLYEEYKGRIEILFESNERPWTAVARGAVLSGVAQVTNQERIHSHVSRYSYGWAMCEDFNHRIHDEEDHDIHDVTGRSIARDQMEWIIRRGESVETRSSRIYQYTRILEIHEVGFVSFSETIYRSNLRLPPKRLVANEATNNLSTPGEFSEFQKYAIIEMRTHMPVEELPRRGGRENPHREFDYQVEVNISGASLMIKATSNGNMIGEKIIPGLFEQAGN
ncbi:hypothetical protein GGR55DRAFT_700775 [Xylaria sp. FL0064]|nr:hypothetical protein GGR55DRAFT_700775 [Xylaria sp. FL0064]